MTKKVERRSLNRKNGLIALLTDFGSRDHYVGTMKGVILSINPRARMLDISHDITPHHIKEAAYQLWASYRFFPPNTIFVAVVDPGVGSDRKIISIETPRHTFLAPDNGLLDLVIAREDIQFAYEILQPPLLKMEPVSPTFHGRDIIAPIAALLSIGKRISQFGKQFAVRKPRALFYDPRHESGVAQILHIDRFGNIVTNIPKQFFEASAISIGTTKISTHISNYAEAPENQPCLIVGSNGLIEICIKEGSAARILRVDLNTPLSVLKSR